MKTTYEAGNPVHFQELYEEMYPVVVGKLTSILHDRSVAEDIAQTSFANAFDHWAEWQPTRPPQAWIWRIAMNTMISHTRRMKMREDKAPLIWALTTPPAVDPEAEAHLDMLKRQVREAVKLLPKKQAAVFVLHYWQDLPRAEIARRLGIPQGTVSSRIFKGLDKLEELLRITGVDEDFLRA